MLASSSRFGGGGIGEIVARPPLLVLSAVAAGSIKGVAFVAFVIVGAASSPVLGLAIRSFRPLR